ALTNPRLEVREVRLTQIALAHDGVERVAQGLRSAVDGVVLHRGDGLEVLRVVALKPPNELDGELARQKRILAVRLLAAPPTRVAKDVDVRRPERESLVPLPAVVTQVLLVLRARLVGDDGCHLEDQTVVPRRGHSYCLREHGGQAGSRDAMERFVPPVVRRYTESVDRGRDVLHLLDFFLQRHPADEIAGARLEWERLILIGQRLCDGTDADCRNKRDHTCESGDDSVHGMS